MNKSASLFTSRRSLVDTDEWPGRKFSIFPGWFLYAALPPGDFIGFSGLPKPLQNAKRQWMECWRNFTHFRLCHLLNLFTWQSVWRFFFSSRNQKPAKPNTIRFESIGSQQLRFLRKHEKSICSMHEWSFATGAVFGFAFRWNNGTFLVPLALFVSRRRRRMRCDAFGKTYRFDDWLCRLSSVLYLIEWSDS